MKLKTINNMLQKYNRKFIHNMPKLAFPTRLHIAKMENTKQMETPKQEVAQPVEKVEKTREVRKPKKTVIQPVVEENTNENVE